MSTSESAKAIESGNSPASRHGYPIPISGRGLTVANIAQVAQGARVSLTGDEETLARIHESSRFIQRAVEADTPIYGVTTCFGGMADRVIPKDTAAELQRNLVWSHKAGDRRTAAGGRRARGDAAARQRANRGNLGRAPGNHPALRDLPELRRHPARTRVRFHRRERRPGTAGLHRRMSDRPRPRLTRWISRGRKPIASPRSAGSAWRRSTCFPRKGWR